MNTSKEKEVVYMETQGEGKITEEKTTEEKITEEKTTKEKTTEEKITEEKILDTLNRISQDIGDKAEQPDGHKYVFNPKEGGCRVQKGELLHLQKELQKKRYKVELYEDIEENDAGTGKKYYILLTGKNNNYVEIDFFKYREKCMDSRESVCRYISGYVDRLVGVKSEEDEEAVKQIVEYLSIAVYDREEYIKAYRNLEWSEYDGKDIFKYNIIYSYDRNIRGKCTNEINGALSPGENNNEVRRICRWFWVEQAVRVMNYSAHASLIIAAGISGIVRQMLTYTKETNINMNIVGDRATGKSTISHFVLSLFGNPTFLEGSYTDTDNAMEAIRAERGVIPYVMDERMLKVEGSTERIKKKSIMLDIFREYEGRVKERLGKQYEGISGKRTCSPVISSSVESMTGMIYDYGDIGQFRRFIELKIDDEKTLFESAAEAERTEDTAYTYYGYGIEVLMQYIFIHEPDYKDRLQERFNSINDAIKKKLGETEKKNGMKGLQSSSMRFALLVVSYLTLIDALRHYMEQINGGSIYKQEEGDEWTLNDRLIEIMEQIEGICKQEEGDEWTLKDRSIEITDILVDNIVDKMKMVRASINVGKDIIRFIEKHRELFHTGDEAWDGEGEYLGHLMEGENEYIVEMRKNSNVGWFMISQKEYGDEELRGYVRTCIENNYGIKNKKIADRLADLLEEKQDESFMKYIKRFVGGSVRTDERHTKSRRFDQIIVSRGNINASDTDMGEDGNELV